MSCYSPSTSPFTIGSWRVRPFDGILERSGERRHLRPKSMDVLVLLASSPRVTVPREELLERVWEGRVVEDGSVARCIAEIRSVLEDDAKAPRYVQTVPRRGYRLLVPVDSTGNGSNGQHRRRRPPLLAAAALFTAAAVGLLLQQRRPGLRDLGIRSRPANDR